MSKAYPRTSDQTPLTCDQKSYKCYQIRKALESLDELEELRNLAIKETEGNMEIQNTIPS